MSTIVDEAASWEIHRRRKGECAFLSFSPPLANRILASDVHLVEHGAKAKLLSRVVPFSEQYKATAKQILGYVQGLSEGALRDVFTLKSDDIGHIPLRLLNPSPKNEDLGFDQGDLPNANPKLKHQTGHVEISKEPDRIGSLEAEESYVTASYCWLKPVERGDVNIPATETKPQEETSIAEAEDELPSYPLPVSSLLYHALLNERKSPREGVWIDQVCIDQSSSSEKQIAVNAMDLIYKCARTVVVLLDDIEVSLAEQDFLTSYIVEFEEYDGEGGFRGPHFKEQTSFMKANPVLRDFFLKFVGAKWFERAWCMHEMRLSPQHVFLIRCVLDPNPRNGLKPLPTVLRFTNTFMMHLIGLAIPADLKHPRLAPLLSVFGDSLITRLGLQPSVPSYMQVFADVFRQNAGGNPAIPDFVEREHDANLDKLSIAINTVGVGLGVTRAKPINAIDYSQEESLPSATADECCRRFTILAIAAADPSALCSKGAELQLGQEKGPRTWMHWPMFDDIGTSSEDMSRLRSFNVDFDPGASATYLGLDMYFYNGDGRGPRAGGVKWASERKLKICRAFKDGCELRKIASVHYNFVYGESLDRLQIRKAVIRTIAAIMECGLDWLLWMGEHVLEGWNTGLLVKAVQRLLEHEKINSVRGREGEVLPTKYLDSQPGRREAELLLDLARYLVHQGLPWSYEKSMAAYEAVCIIGDREVVPAIRETAAIVAEPCCALMFACVPEAGSIVDVICAIPAVLLHEEYSALFRGWTLAKGTPVKEADDAGVEKWKFHLLGKSAVFGVASGTEKPEHENRPPWRQLVRNVRMYGPGDG